MFAGLWCENLKKKNCLGTLAQMGEILVVLQGRIRLAHYKYEGWGELMKIRL
jgi:hypothetical protein